MPYWKLFWNMKPCVTSHHLDTCSWEVWRKSIQRKWQKWCVVYMTKNNASATQRHTCPRCSHHSRSVAGSAHRRCLCQMLLPAQTVTPSSTHTRWRLHRNTRACFRHESYWLLHQPACWSTKDVDRQAAASHECSCTYRLEHSEVWPRSDAASTWRSTLVGRHWSHHVQTVCSRLSVLTRHGAIVSVRAVSVGFEVWRTSSSAVFGPQSTRRTSLPSCNYR